MMVFVRKWLIALLACGLFVVAVSLVVQHVLLDSYERLEREAVDRSTEQVVRALQAEQRQIGLVANDYASWDDMYAFAHDANARFAQLNFSTPGLRDMQVDAAFVFDEKGREVFSAEQQPGAEAYLQPASRELERQVLAAIVPLRNLTAANKVVPLLRTARGVAVAVARPIIHTDRSGPERGTLVLLRRVGAAMAARMSDSSQLPAKLWDIGISKVDDLPAGVLAWGRSSFAGSASLSIPVDQDIVRGFARLSDVAGAPALIVGTQLPRTLYQQGRETARYLIVAIVTLVLLVLVVAAVLDAKLQRSTQRARDSETLYRAVVEQAEEGIALVDPDSQTILECNPAMNRLTARDDRQLTSEPIDRLFEAQFAPRLWSLLSGSGEVERKPIELALLRPDGTRGNCEVMIYPLTMDSRRLGCMILRDVSQRKSAEERILDHQRQLEHLANHDVLTDLPNRMLLMEKLPQIIEQAGRDGAALATFHVDVDHFKNINDSGGHELGDQFLREFAGRLRSSVAQDDLVARVGSDEFVVISRARDARVFEGIARRIGERMRVPLQVGARQFAASVSLGVAVFPRDGRDAGELLRNADIALYQAKERGRDSYQFFTRDMTARVHERATLEHALRAAIAAGDISVHYQPVIDLQSERVVGFEALARWRHADFGNVTPAQFIPVAEESGLIVELGESVLRKVCAQLADWNRAGLMPVPVAVNVSAQQLQRTDVYERVMSACAAYGVSPRLLRVELTESVVMREIERHVGTLERLRSAGVGVSIDDFGTGYSSLSYLKHLPIDHLKIDRSFVRDMAVDVNDAAIVSAIINMARSLKLETIAEGVETAQHALRLLGLGCQLAQGYHFSPAVPAADCERFLQRAVDANAGGSAA